MTVVSSTIKAATLVAAGQAAAGAISPTVAALITGVTKAMFMTQIKSVLAVVLVVGLALGGIGAGVGLLTNPVAVAQENTPDKGKQPADKAGPKEDQTPKKNLEGVWSVVSVEDNDKNKLDFDPIFSYVAGTQAPASSLRLTFRDQKFALKTGPVSLEGGYSLESAKEKEKEISLTVTTGSPDMEGLISISGVYSLDEDKLTITFGKLNASQPAGLAEKKPGVCYTLRRESLPKKKEGKK
jgi:hypothetical protein